MLYREYMRGFIFYNSRNSFSVKTLTKAENNDTIKLRHNLIKKGIKAYTSLVEVYLFRVTT